MIGGSSRSTSGASFARRSTNGPTRARRRSSARASRRTSIGRAKLRSNASREPSSPGLTSSMIAQSSPRRFSIGVPVSASVRFRGRRRNARWRFVRAFFTSCASSRSSRSHATPARRSASRVATSYEVTTTSLAAAVSRKAAPRSRARAVMEMDAQIPARTGRSRAPTAGRRSSGRRRASGRRRHRPPAPRRSVAMACTVLPRPMSSARIPPTRRSLRSRSQPCPRSWKGKRS